MTADGLSLDDKRTPVAENDIPDIIERFKHLGNEKNGSGQKNLSWFRNRRL